MKGLVRALLFAVLAAARPGSAQTDYVDDQALRGLLQRHLERLHDATNRIPLAALRAQLGRTNAVVQLARPSSRERTWAEIYERVKDSVFIVSELYTCSKCTKWHVNAASGFVISRDGALVTNHHVVDKGTGVVIGAMSLAGEFFPVKEVLAASSREDVAILRLDGRTFTPLPLLADKPVGSAVAVLSHPDTSFFSLTEGIISRYSVERVSRRDSRRRHSLVITADYAKGSSGAPVFDNCGNVVGVAASTQSVYYDEDHGRHDDLQQVFKYCVPAGCVLDLIRNQ